MQKNRIFYDELCCHKPSELITYSDLLNTIDWDIKRHKIFKRDGYKCKECNALHGLDVHHNIYIDNKLPWDYDDKDLITLCKTCHSKIHDKRPEYKLPKTWFKDPLYKNYRVRLRDEM